MHSLVFTKLYHMVCLDQELLTESNVLIFAFVAFGMSLDFDNYL